MKSTAGGRDANRDTYERLVLEGMPYLCRIPYVAPLDDNSTAVTAEEHQQELARASDHGLKLLQGLQGNCLYYAGGWWVYSFCYNDGIKQFHPLVPGKGGIPLFPPQEDSSIGSFVLGKFEGHGVEATTPADGADSVSSASRSAQAPPTTPQLETRGETKFLVQRLGGGTVCDLTGRPRRVEVQFHCNPTAPDRINLIKETSSCIYLMVIHTPLLCNDVAFLPPQVDKPNSISCSEIVASDDVENWKKWKATSKAEVQELQRHATPPEPIARPLIIGGIEIGAQKLVGGSPDRTISPSRIISGGGGRNGEGDKFLARLAYSDGVTISFMTDQEIDRLGLKAARAKVEEYRTQMKQLAGNGVPWNLDLYGTPSGWEFRMIIGTDEREDDQPPKGAAGPSEAVPEEEQPPGSQEEYK